MAQSTVSSLNSLFNSIYEDAIFVAREENLMTGLVTTYSARGLATRYLPIYPQMSAQDVAEGVDFSNATEWTKTAQMTLTPSIAKTQAILTEARIATDPDDARRDLAMEMGGAIATKIDTDLVDLFSGFSTGKGSSGNALTIKNCGAALSVLRTVPVRNPIYFVLHPYGWHDIWTELAQPAATYDWLGETANQAMRDYAVGNFLSAQWFISANISLDSTPDAIGAAFNREALAFDLRMAPTMLIDFDASIAGGGGHEINMEVWYGVSERRDTYGVKLTHDATEPT